jgi:protein subunit release factor A
MPEVVSNMDKFKKISKEYRDLEKVVEEYKNYKLIYPHHSKVNISSSNHPASGSITTPCLHIPRF